jgi:UDP-N-acetylglucosamine 2-epimerase
LSWVHKLMTNPDEYAAMSEVNNPYGDGKACDRIVARILNKDTTRLSWFEKAMDLVRVGQGQVKEQM